MILLAYADDIVLFANTPAELRRLLDALYSYCIENKLKINVNKTQIVQFHQGRRAKEEFSDFSSFNFGNEVIKVVPDYNY